jgi:hypothetical protein
METTMYSALSYDLMQARVADMHRQAQRDALARAARGVRQPQSGHPARSLPAVTARRELAVLTARGA